jgi:hypothetical protein
MSNRFRIVAVVLLPVLVAAAPEPESAAREDLTRWQWLVDLEPPAGASGRMDCILTPAVFDKARPDLGDLRLIDGKGREIPYALRIRRSQVEPQEIPATPFNQARHPDGSAESCADLGLNLPENRSLTIEPDGANYRRRAQVQGSDDRADWRTLVENVPVVSLRVGDQAIDARTVSYPVSRFRYLRVQVFPDKTGGDTVNPPRFKVWQAAEKVGEDFTVRVAVSAREPIPTPAGPGSAWYLSIQDGNRADLAAYWENLSFDLSNSEFSRSYSLETADPGSTVRRLNIGESRWSRVRGDAQPLSATFPEILARRLRLVVIDNRDPPLQIQAVRSTTAARQLVFTPPDHWAPPLRLYFGNPDAAPGRYNDYASGLPAVLDPAPSRVRPSDKNRGDPEKNPEYVAPPKPFTELFPWMIYVVLGLAGLTLLGILLYLARRAVARHDAKAPVSTPAG